MRNNRQLTRKNIPDLRSYESRTFQIAIARSIGVHWNYSYDTFTAKLSIFLETGKFKKDF